MKTYSKYFMTKERADGKKFVCRTEEPCLELDELVRSIHDRYEVLPNDWIYATIKECISYRDEKYFEYGELADLYTYDLLIWLAENEFARVFCDDLLEAEGSRELTLWDILYESQINLIGEIFDQVDEFFQKMEF